MKVAEKHILKATYFDYPIFTADWTDLVVFFYNTFAYSMQYYYVNSWGAGEPFKLSLWSKCDDSIRAMFYQEEVGRMYAKQGIIST